MKNIDELLEFYNSELNQDLEVLEKERKETVTKLFKYAFIILVIGAIASYIYKMIAGSFSSGFALFFLAILPVVYMLVIQKYKANYKEKIIKPIIKKIDKSFNYSPSSGVNKQVFDKAKLFHDYNVFESEDLVRGSIEGVAFNFCEVRLFHEEDKGKNYNNMTQSQRENYKEKRQNRKEGLNIDFKASLFDNVMNNINIKSSMGKSGGSHKKVVFKGLYVSADFNKNFSARTVVLPDTATKIFGDMLGGWLQASNMVRDNLVKLDNPEFEKAFVVYATDGIEARYILSPTLMERILNFKQKFDKELYISFVDSNIHIAIPSEEDLFEPSVFNSVKDNQQTKEYIETILLSVSIVEELKLNDRLWNKA